MVGDALGSCRRVRLNRAWARALCALLGACLALPAAAAAAAAAPDAGPAGMQLEVSTDAAEQSGEAHAVMRIRAPTARIWPLITDCNEAIRLIPGLIECKVLETGRDGAWQRIRHVVNYSWYLPKMTYELRATYDEPRRMVFERIAGAFKRLTVVWEFAPQEQATVVTYRVYLDPGFWVPHWLVRNALRHDLPQMLSALRSRAEAPEAPRAEPPAPDTPAPNTPAPERPVRDRP